MFDPELYRDKAEVELWKLRDPLALLETRLTREGALDQPTTATLESEVSQEIAAAVVFAEAGTWEPVADLTKDVYTR